jgi:GNAT superfamily N-acetyltransferase
MAADSSASNEALKRETYSKCAIEFGMDIAALAWLVESSEADAYRTLAECAHSESEQFVAKGVGGGVAIISPSITTTLNLNRVIGLGVREPATLEQLDEIDHLYRARGLSFGIEVGPLAQPLELVAWLRARRLRRGVATAMLYRPIDRVRQPSGEVEVRMAEASEASLVAAICCETFRMPPAAHRIFEGARGSARWRQWLAFIGATPVGAALSFVGDSVAWLGWDATVPAFRGKGVQAALIARRLQDAREIGCGYATSETAVGVGERRDPSFRNYERMGFAFAYDRFTYISLGRSAGARA